MALPVLSLSNEQVEALASLPPGSLMDDGMPIDAEPNLTEYLSADGKHSRIEARHPDGGHYVAAWDQDLARWLLLQPGKPTERYLADPASLLELDRNDILSVHRDATKASEALRNLAGPCLIDKARMAAAVYAKSAGLAIVAATSLQRWVDSTQQGFDEADALMDQYQAEQLKLTAE